MIYLITFLCAACSMIYELLLAQAIVERAGNTVVWYSLTIGLYLAAMGLGAFASRRISKDRLWPGLFKVEMILSLTGALSVIWAFSSYILFVVLWAGYVWQLSHVLFFLLSFAMILTIGFFTGCELPLLIRIEKRSATGQNLTARVLSIDYLGSLAGALCFSLFLLPRFSLIVISLMTALVNLILAFFIALRFISQKREKKIVLCAMFFVILIAVCLRLESIEQYFLKRYYYYDIQSENPWKLFWLGNDHSPVKRIRSAYQTIDLVQTQGYAMPFSLIKDFYSQKALLEKDYPRNTALYLDGQLQFLSDSEEIYHEYFAHVPVILKRRVPKDVLVLGAGDGLLVRELAKYTDIKSITVVEIDPRMIELAKGHPVFLDLNKGVFFDLRVKIIVEDAYHYVKNTEDKFDAIYMDFPHPKDYKLSKLYSREFYYFVRRALKADGFAVMDAPSINLFKTNVPGGISLSPLNMWPVYVNTLKSAGFKGIIPFSSLMEPDNPKAVTAIKKQIGQAEAIIVEEFDLRGYSQKVIEGQNNIVSQILKDFIADHAQGFIFLQNKPLSAVFNYKDPGIPLYVLNKERFDAAFSYPLSSGKQDDVFFPLVNTILCPSLPNSHYWLRLKLPN